MKHLQILSAIGILLSTSCMNKEEKSSIPVLNIDPTNSTTLNFSRIFDHYEIIPLCNDTVNLLTKPFKIEIKDSLIYFSNANSLYSYTHEGKCKLKINNVGVGPGEYLSLADFSLNDNCIEINDRDGRKIYRYTYDGVYLNSFNHRLFSYSFKKLEDHYIFHSGCLYNKELNNDYRVNILDENGHIKKSYFKIDKYEREINIMEYSNFASFNDTLSFSYCLSNYIYDINSETNKRLKINFGDYNLPYNYIKEHNNIIDFMNSIKNVKYASLIDGYKESSKFLFFSYAFQGERPFVLLNKSTNQVYHFNRFNDDLLFENTSIRTGYAELPVLLTNEAYYRFIEASDIIEILEEHKKSLTPEEWTKFKQKHEKLYQISQNISAESNPVIVKYYFKSNEI